MLRTSNRKVTTALLCAASVLCLSGAALALDRTVKVEADDASYGYNVKFYEDFNDGQLKEGWEYVYGEISDDAVTYGKNAGGKMLYNTGAKEYAYSVDITMGTENNTTNPNVHMPILVADPEIPEDNSDDSWRITDGITVNFTDTQIQLWNFSAGTGSKLSSTNYGALVKFGVQQTWTVVVGANIEIYVDGVFFAGVATPEHYTSDDFTSFYCGIGAGKIGSSTFTTTFTYDNFVVYEKDEANTATTSLYDFSNIVKGKTVTAEGDTDGKPLVSATPTSQGTKIVLDSTVKTEEDNTGKNYQKNTHWLGTDTFGDFTMTINVSATGTQMNSGIYFGAEETTNGVSGYRLALSNGNAAKLYLWQVSEETDTENGATECVWGDATGKPYNTAYPVVLKVQDKKITLSYTDSDGATQSYTPEEEAATTISGYMGFRLTDNANKIYSSTFTMAVSTLSTEDTSVMTKATLTSTNDTKYVYSVRKNTTLGLDDLGLNAVAFVNDDESLTEKALSVGDEAVEGKVLTVNSFAVEGAAIRVIDPAGIRFKTAISKADVTALQSYDEITIEEVGTILLPSELLATSGGVLTNTTEKVVTATVSVVNEVSGTDMYKYWGTLTKIPATDYETEISACGYMKITLTLDGKEVTRYVYTDVLARSLAGVAQAALDDKDGGYSEEQRAQLEIYAAGNKAAE